jgi:tryptophan synthase alpha subunit
LVVALVGVVLLHQILVDQVVQEVEVGVEAEVQIHHFLQEFNQVNQEIREQLVLVFLAAPLTPHRLIQEVLAVAQVALARPVVAET